MCVFVQAVPFSIFSLLPVSVHVYFSLTHFCLFVYLYRMFVFTHVGGRDKRLNSLLFSCFVLYF